MESFAIEGKDRVKFAGDDGNGFGGGGDYGFHSSREMVEIQRPDTVTVPRALGKIFRRKIL